MGVRTAVLDVPLTTKWGQTPDVGLPTRSKNGVRPRTADYPSAQERGQTPDEFTR
jgi:hypothetical protein